MKDFYIVRVIMSLMVAFFLCSNLNAQIFSETTFDPGSLVADGNTPDDALWYETINVSGNHKHWVFSGGIASLTKETAKPGDLVKTYLISPQITLAAGSNELTFVQSQTKVSATTEFKVLISTTTRDISSFATLLSYTGATGFNTTETIDLSAFAGETIYLAFVRILPDIKGEDWNLSSVIVDGSDVLEVSNFVISSVQDTEVGMYWAKNDNSNDVLVAFSTDGVFGDPIDGTSYDPLLNNSIAGGGTVLYVGDIIYDEASPFLHSGLTEFTPYYYKIWSLDASNNYSYSGIELNATTTGAETILYADFEDETGDNAWAKGSDGWEPEKHEWFVGPATSYRGTQCAYVTTDGGSTADYVAATRNPIYLSKSITIPAGQYKSLELSFFWKAGGNLGLDYGEVYWGGTSAGDIISSAQEFNNQSQWTEKNIDLTDHVDLVNGGTYTLYFSWKSAWATSPNNPGFCVDDVRITGRTVARPTDFTAAVSGTNSVQLTWTPDNPSDDVLIAYSSSGTFGDPLIGDPVKGISYFADDYLPGGGQVIYIGKDGSYLHEDVASGVAYYKAWTVGAGSTYSVGVSTSTSMPVSLPFNEDFEEDATSFSFGSNQYHAWEHGRAVKNGGTKSAYVSVDNGLTASYSMSANNGSVDLILPVNLKGFKNVQLDFMWMCDAAPNNEYGQVYIDGNNLDGTQYSNQTSWTSKSISINPAYLGSVSEIKFRMYKNNSGIVGSNPGFCVDDISLSGSIYAPSDFTAVNGNTNANDLSWTNYIGLEEVVIVAEELTSGDVAGTLTSGNAYSEGDILSGGGTIIYIGTGTSYIHSGLKLNTRYAYKIWHKSGLIYSDEVDAAVANATTPLNVGFFEDFENDGSGYKHGWLISDADLKSNQFVQGTPGNITPFSGNEVMFVSDDGGVNATYSKGGGTINFVLDGETIDLSGFSSAYLSFYSLVGGGAGKGEGAVIISGSGLPETTVMSSVFSDASWTKREVNITPYLSYTPIVLKFQWTSGSSATQPAWCIDNIAITGAYDDNSTLTNPSDISGRALEVSSLSNSVANATMIMNFDINDAGTADGKSTMVNGLTFRLDPTSSVTDLSDVLSGAYLKEKDGAILGYATVYSSTLVFQQENIITVADGMSTTYELYLYLKTTMEINGDNETLKLNLTENDLVAYNGSGFGGGASEDIANTTPIDVDVTKLYFTVEPSVYNPANQTLLTTPVVWAVDINNNLDKDYQGTVTLTNDLISNSGTSLASSGNVDSNPSKNGVAVFPSYTFTEAGGPVVITASDGTFTGSFQPVTISSYCNPAMSSNTSYISLVDFNELNYYSNNDGLSVAYYLEQSTNLTRNVSYTLTVGVNAVSGDQIKAWIDWDQDGIFADGTFIEEYAIGTASGGVENFQEIIPVPASATLGGTRLRIMVSSDVGLTACDPGTGANGETEDYTVVITNNQWLGLTPTWDVTTNWSSGAAPLSGQDVTIASDIEGSFYPIVTSNLVLGDLDLQAGSRFTINEGVQVTVDQLVNNGTLILKSRYDNLSSFISTSEAGIGEAQTVMYYPSRRYWYTGHAVEGATSADYNPEDTEYSYVYRYNGGWVRIADNNTPFIQPMEGYAVIFKNASTISHTGPIRGGGYDRSLSAGWHIVANPYPSYVDLDLERTSSGVHWNFTNVQRTVYVRTTVGTERVLAAYPIDDPAMATNGATRYIAPMQSFWVNANSGGATVGIESTARVHSSGSLKSTRTTSNQILKLALENKYTRDELVLAFTSDGSVNKLTKDALKRFETNERVPYLFANKDGLDIVIGYYTDGANSQSIQLYNTVGEDGAGETVFKAMSIDQFDTNTEVLLEDKATGSLIDLRLNPNYTFSNSISDSEDRFVLHLSKVATDISDSELINGDVLIRVVDGNKLNIDCDWDNSKSVAVFSVDGRKVFEDTFNGSEYVNILNIENGIYIVKVFNGDAVCQEKVKIDR